MDGGLFRTIGHPQSMGREKRRNRARIGIDYAPCSDLKGLAAMRGRSSQRFHPNLPNRRAICCVVSLRKADYKAKVFRRESYSLRSLLHLHFNGLLVKWP